MAKWRRVLTVATVLALGFGLSCSSDDGDDDDSGSSNNNPNNPNNPVNPNNPNATATDPAEVVPSQNEEFRDIDGDGVLDPLQSSDFGIAGVPVTEADIEAVRNSACTGWVVEPEPLGAVLFMVLDASSSMNDLPPEGGTASKWEVTRDALTQAIGELSDDTALGLLGYPNRQVSGQSGDPRNCVNIDALVPLTPLSSGRQTVIDGLNAIETNTCTPTYDAYNAGLQEFANTPAAGTKYMMLMTDGQPTLYENCTAEDGSGQCTASLPQGSSEQPVIDLIAGAFTNQGIKTFVLGCPGSEVHSQTGLDNRWWMSQAAELGGTSPGNCSHDAEPYCHFDMTGEGVNFADELRMALRDIVGQVVACDYAIPVPPEGLTIDLNAINLYIYPDGNEPIQILRTEGPDCDQGWYYDETTGYVRLCPVTCAIAQTDPNAKAELMFGCESDVILPQ